jgi:serine/threonine protein kinase
MSDIPAEVELRGEEEDVEVFGRFHIVEKLGEGTYGKVYKAISNQTG